MAFLPGALFAATLLLSPAAQQTDSTAQDRLDQLHQRVLTACRHENRHGAMAARGVRACVRDTLDRAVAASGDRCLQALHTAPSLPATHASCDNPTRIAQQTGPARDEHDRDS